MKRNLQLVLFIFLNTGLFSQTMPGKLLGKLSWNRLSKQGEKQLIQVNTIPVVVNKLSTVKDSPLIMVQQPIDPQTTIIHRGPILPTTETIEFNGKKIGPPKKYEAQALLNRDNAGFNVSYSDKSHGFPKSTTTDLAEDLAHNIWMATEDGLVKYDGTNYYVYDQSNGLPDISEFSIAIDQKNRIWLATNNGAYFIQNDSLYTIKSNHLAFSTLTCTNVQIDRLGRIWISTFKTGAICLSGNKISIYNKNCGIISNDIHTAHLDKNGNILLGSNEDGLFVIEPNQIKLVFKKSGQLTYSSFTSIMEDEDGIWAAVFMGGLVKMGPKDTIRYSMDGKFNERVFDMLKVPEGIWISTYSKGVYFYNKNKLLLINEDNGLRGNYPYRLFKDSFENIWVSSVTSGFSRLNKTGFYLTSFANPNISHVLKIIPDKKGASWITTYGKKLIKYDGKYASKYSIKLKEKKGYDPLDFINDGIIDRFGNLWLASFTGGITRILNEKTALFYYSNNIGSWNPLNIKQDSKNRIWFNPAKNGLIMFDHEKFWQFTDKNGLLNNNVTGLFQDEFENIYLSFSNGFQKYIDNHLETFFINDQRFKDKVNGMIALGNNSFLLTTSIKGILLLNNGKVYQFNTDNSIASNNIKSILSDHTGKIWITTEKGIETFRINGISMTEHRVFNESTGTFIMDTNVAGTDLEGLPFWSMNENKLIFDKQFDNKSSKSPIIKITNMEVGDAFNKDYANTTILQHEKITINYQTVYWGRENILRLNYLLISEDLDTTIRSIPISGKIIINDLIPGIYTLMIEAIDNNVVHYSKKISIEVKNYWYNTILFRIFFAGIFIVGIILFYRRKNQKQIALNEFLESKIKEQTKDILNEKEALYNSFKIIDKQNKEKDILIDEINHRVKNNLQFISAMIEMQIGTQESDIINNALLDTNRRINAMSLVHELLYLNKEQEGLSMKSYIHELAERLKEMALSEKTDITIDIEVEDLIMDSKASLAIGMIVSELVSNSFKHAFKSIPEPEIYIGLKKLPLSENLQLIVKDNGKGYNLSFNQSLGLGNKLIDIFSRQLGGDYTIETKGQFTYLLEFKMMAE